MPFPEAPKVIYKRNPLVQVICQLRFPPILRIDTEAPAGFQECIRRDFPEFEEKEETRLGLSLPQRIQKDMAAELLREVIPSRTKNYEFASQDRVWRVNLTRSFIALSTSKYRRGSEFNQKLEAPVRALREMYKPAYFSRIGLRYVDVIKRSALGLRGVSWNELLKPAVLGLLSWRGVSENIATLEGKCEIRLEDEKSMARIVTGLVESEGNDEECFMIDTDFFNTDRTEIGDVRRMLEYFQVRGSRLIQWFITERLHAAMEPEEL